MLIRRMVYWVYLKLRQMIDGSPYLKEKYFQLAVFCTNHGVNPPLSQNSKKVEARFKEQESEDRNPYLYTEHNDSVTYLFQDILPFLKQAANILEIGCNSSRSLNYLYNKGYKKFTGIEIGQKAEDVMKEVFPDAYSATTFITGNACEELVKLPTASYDLVFCHSVLVNIAPKWNSIFKELARVSKSYILILENEGSVWSYPRNFEKMFERVGYKQIVCKFYNVYKEKGKIELAPNFNKKDSFMNNTIRLFVPFEK